MPQGGKSDKWFINMKINRILILSAQFFSRLTSPFYLPLLAFLLVFSFSHLRLLSWQYKLIVLAMVYAFTALLPRFIIYLYRKLNGWGHRHLGHREKRYVPYIISIICYGGLLHMMYKLYLPQFTMRFILGALVLQLVCLVLNPIVKVSTHAAGAGAVTGALMVIGFIFNFNPLVWISVSILYAGLVCSARFILRVHTLPELGIGVFVGWLCGMLSMIIF